MLLVIPVSRSSEALLEPLKEVLTLFGPYPRHKVIVVSAPSDTALAGKFMSSISNLFGQAEVYSLPLDGPAQEPQRGNYCWSTVAHHLQFEKKSLLPWLWLLPSSTPTRSGWLDNIEAEYNLAKMPFLGGGKVSVFPPNMGDHSSLYMYAPQMDKPFDELCKWEIKPKLHSSKLIQYSGSLVPDTLVYCGDGSLALEIIRPKPVKEVAKEVKVDAEVVSPSRKRQPKVAAE
jgi:hypothetical protein